jgi:hypothetical protein
MDELYKPVRIEPLDLTALFRHADSRNTAFNPATVEIGFARVSEAGLNC